MRIEIDIDLEKDLDEIKSQKYLYGKGHTSTIRFLVNQHQQHKQVSKVLENELKKIPEIMEASVTKVIRNVFMNLTKPRE